MKCYFTFDEMIKTDTGLENTPPKLSVIYYNIDKLITVLNIIRCLVGVAIYVNSAYRSPAVNEVVGGALHSLHLDGRAADIRCSNMELLKSVCKEYYQKGILIEYIEYDNFIHIAI